MVTNPEDDTPKITFSAFSVHNQNSKITTSIQLSITVVRRNLLAINKHPADIVVTLLLNKRDTKRQQSNFQYFILKNSVKKASTTYLL